VDGVGQLSEVRHLKGVGVDEVITAVVRLRLDVHAKNVEARVLVALGRSTGAAKKIYN